MSDFLPFVLPSPVQYTTEAQWLEAVGQAVKEAGFEVDAAVLRALWLLAKDTIYRMDDVFWDVDEYDPCACCREPGECPNAYRVGPGEYRPKSQDLCPEWPGRWASQRLSVACAAEVLESLLMCYCAPQQTVKSMEVSSYVDCPSSQLTEQPA